MSELQVNEQAFKDKSAWKRTEDGIRRSAMNGHIVDVVNVGNDFYQPIVNRYSFPRWDKFEPQKCITMDEAIDYAWNCTRTILEKPLYDGPPARVEMTPE